MHKFFNTDGYCDPRSNYMINLSERLAEIKNMIDAGKYFTINKARQYGKTTTLIALANYLKADYDVISLDFQGLSNADMAVISNRIYEAVLYNYFLAEEFADSKMYNAGLQENNRCE